MSAGNKRVRKCSIEWSLELTLTLIENVRNFQNLWDPSHKKYKNHDLIDNSWNYVADMLGIPKNEALLRWNAICGNYQTHFRKWSEKKDGAETIDFRKMNPIFRELKFLDPVLTNESKHQEQQQDKKKSILKRSNIQFVKFSEPMLCNSMENTLSSSLLLKCDDPDDAYLHLDSVKCIEESTIPSSGEPHSHSPQKDMTCNNTCYENKTMKTSWNSLNNDEWKAFGNLIASNARAWASEDLTFARRYKAALSTVNAQFEIEAANNL